MAELVVGGVFPAEGDFRAVTVAFLVGLVVLVDIPVVMVSVVLEISNAKKHINCKIISLENNVLMCR